jgi:hypothetical protein
VTHASGVYRRARRLTAERLLPGRGCRLRRVDTLVDVAHEDHPTRARHLAGPNPRGHTMTSPALQYDPTAHSPSAVADQHILAEFERAVAELARENAA